MIPITRIGNLTKVGTTPRVQPEAAIFLIERSEHPDVVRCADHVAVPSIADREIRGAANVATEALTHADRGRFAQSAVVDGSAGIIVAARGQLFMALRCKVTEGRIVEMEVIADPERLRRLDLAAFDE